EVLTITSREDEDAQHITRVYNVTDLVGQIQPGSHEEVQENVENLIDLIWIMCGPTVWFETGGPAQFMIHGAYLVCSQSRAIHEEIDELLAQLRADKPSTSKSAKAHQAQSLDLRTYDVRDLVIGSDQTELPQDQRIVQLRELVRTLESALAGGEDPESPVGTV